MCAVVWGISVDPRNKSDEILAAQVRLARGLANLFDQLALMRTERQRRLGREVGAAITALKEAYQVFIENVLVGDVKLACQSIGKVQLPLGFLAAVTVGAVLVKRRLDVELIVDRTRPRVSRLRRERLHGMVPGQRQGTFQAGRLAAQFVAAVCLMDVLLSTTGVMSVGM